MSNEKVSAMLMLAIIDACKKSKSFDDLLFSMGVPRLSSFTDDSELIAFLGSEQKGSKFSVKNLTSKALIDISSSICANDDQGIGACNTDITYTGDKEKPTVPTIKG